MCHAALFLMCFSSSHLASLFKCAQSLVPPSFGVPDLVILHFILFPLYFYAPTSIVSNNNNLPYLGFLNPNHLLTLQKEWLFCFAFLCCQLALKPSSYYPIATLLYDWIFHLLIWLFVSAAGAGRRRQSLKENHDSPQSLHFSSIPI